MTTIDQHGIARQPEGSPDGGRFAAIQKPESKVALDVPTSAIHYAAVRTRNWAERRLQLASMKQAAEQILEQHPDATLLHLDNEDGVWTAGELIDKGAVGVIEDRDLRDDIDAWVAAVPLQRPEILDLDSEDFASVPDPAYAALLEAGENATGILDLKAAAAIKLDTGLTTVGEVYAAKADFDTATKRVELSGVKQLSELLLAEYPDLATIRVTEGDEHDTWDMSEGFGEDEEEICAAYDGENEDLFHDVRAFLRPVPTSQRWTVDPATNLVVEDADYDWITYDGDDFAATIDIRKAATIAL